MSSLVNKTEQLDSRMAERYQESTAIHHGQPGQQPAKKNNRYPGILHPSTRTLTVDNEAISLVATRHEAAPKEQKEYEGRKLRRATPKKSFDIMEKTFSDDAIKEGTEGDQ